jgi:hypothetical protein
MIACGRPREGINVPGCGRLDVGNKLPRAGIDDGAILLGITVEPGK